MKIDQYHAEIIRICSNKERLTRAHKEKLYQLFLGLSDALKPLDEQSIVALFELLNALQPIKNHKARFIEAEIFTRLLPQITLMIRMLDKVPPDEEGLADYEVSEEEISIAQQLLDFVREILKQKPESSKRSFLRIMQSLAILSDLDDFYGIDEVEAVFWEYLDHQYPEVQFQALLGLERYYAKEFADKISEAEVEQLEQLIHQTTIRENASTCCQILINAGVINEMGAVLRMDDWKEEHWR